MTDTITRVYRIEARRNDADDWGMDIGDDTDCPSLEHAISLIAELRRIDDDWAANDYRVVEVDINEYGDDIDKMEVHRGRHGE